MAVFLSKDKRFAKHHLLCLPINAWLFPSHFIGFCSFAIFCNFLSVVTVIMGLKLGVHVSFRGTTRNGSGAVKDHPFFLYYLIY